MNQQEFHKDPPCLIKETKKKKKKKTHNELALPQL